MVDMPLSTINYLIAQVAEAVESTDYAYVEG